MVMEASPSPQSVGREFVRQYYTLLNKAPSHLHRFYNNHSSFVHGGLDAPNRETNPAIGQKQIHQKIQQLNFRDCHAKISQVDSQATLGNGVVVQVTGELSNAGQPMRRFTQTFVLAAQAPKKYYVHNDIFRYQDLGFPDEEEGDVEGGDGGIGESVGDREPEEGVRSEPEEDEQSNQGHQLPPTSAPLEEQGPPSLIQNQQPQIQQHVYYAPPPQQPVHPVMQPVAINGSVHDESPLINQQQHAHTYISEPANQEQFVQEPEPEVVPEQQQQAEEEAQIPVEESQEQPEAEIEQHSISEPQPEVPVPIQNTSNSGPISYANLVKSKATATGSTSPQAPKPSISPPPISHQRLDDRMPVPTVNSGPILSAPSNINSSQQQVHRGIGGNQQQQQQQQQRAPRGGPVQRGMGRGPPRSPFPSDDNGWDGDRRGGRQVQYGDSHQLFLGNLPLDASEEQLRQLFEQYGPVAELRVHSKQNERGKAPHGASNTSRVPNYGFITFEDHQSVLNVLQNLPIHFPDENGTKLNVEEKKVRPRMSMEGGGGRTSAGDGSIRPMGGQQQRGPGGSGGVMRSSGQPGARGGRGSFSRGGDGGRGGGMRQPGNHSYQNRR